MNGTPGKEKEILKQQHSDNDIKAAEKAAEADMEKDLGPYAATGSR